MAITAVLVDNSKPAAADDPLMAADHSVRVPPSMASSSALSTFVTPHAAVAWPVGLGPGSYVGVAAAVGLPDRRERIGR